MHYNGINRRARTRYYRDTDHRTWRVSPRQKYKLDGEAKTVLVFETPTCLRCVTNYPDDWPTFSADSLERLSWQT